MTGRLPAKPGEEIDRGRTLSFTFDGRRYEGFAGDTVASALMASGVSVLSRSFKYHRPRGVLCCSGRCPNCMVEVDGAPNARACVERVREGMTVRGQNGFPSVARDFAAVFDRFDRLLPVGFYYKTFIRPRWLWPTYEAVLRRLAGLGRVDPLARPERLSRKRNVHCDVAVIGGGPSGVLAALAASESGARVVLIDDQARPGGHLRWSSVRAAGDPRIEGLQGADASGRLAELLAAVSHVEYLANATAFGIYEGNLIGVSQGDDFLRVRARQIVVATGAIERPMLFQNNDRPGVMLASAALRMSRIFGVRPGERAVVATESDHGWHVAADLVEAGVAVVAVVDSRGAAPSGDSPAAALQAGGTGCYSNSHVVDARGVTRVSSAVVEVQGRRRSIACDLIVMATRPEPDISLLGQNGVRPRYDDATALFVPGEPVDGMWVAGHVTGALDEKSAVAGAANTGRSAAAAAARSNAASTSRPTSRPSNGSSMSPVAPTKSAALASSAATVAVPSVPAPGARVDRKAFVCVCEDVTVKDISRALGEGFDSLETVKRYSTVTMGPCQGKMCHSMSARVHAGLTSQSPAATGLTTARPPYQPVTLDSLAGPHLAPVRRTPLHEAHQSLGATWMDMGEWKRPLYYTGVESECRAVREAAGIIDVSTLGKLELSGAACGEFLDWLHPNRFSDLRTARVRYRVMCDDAGIVLDDGTVARLGPHRYFLTTGTTALDAVDQWLHWWLAGSGRDVQVVNVTSQYAAINLAGPRAREVIARLTGLDVSAKGMPYLAAVEGEVAGVPAIILRIGFVGELGYEIHVPADYGIHVWDALMNAGKDLGIAPFGVEAQRVLRLEKQHIIPGQDTDALSNPIEAGLDWAVKADKPDFIGRDALSLVAGHARQNQLVGFEVAGTDIPAEGAAIVRDGKAIGRVTSCKWSAVAGRPIGLAWVPAERAVDGAPLTIRLGVGVAGATTSGTVHMRPFYDPDGARLRS